MESWVLLALRIWPVTGVDVLDTLHGEGRRKMARSVCTSTSEMRCPCADHLASRPQAIVPCTVILHVVVHTGQSSIQCTSKTRYYIRHGPSIDEDPSAPFQSICHRTTYLDYPWSYAPMVQSGVLGSTWRDKCCATGKGVEGWDSMRRLFDCAVVLPADLGCRRRLDVSMV